MTIRRLRSDEAQIFHAFRLEALKDCPQAFGATFEEESQFSEVEIEAQFRGGADDFILGAFDPDGSILGVVGLQRQTRLKRRHSAHVWGLFVSPVARGRGVARKLMEELISRARSIDGLGQLSLGVVMGCDVARQLYVSCGFEPYGIEPRAHRHGQAFLAMEHMTLWLDRSRS